MIKLEIDDRENVKFVNILYDAIKDIKYLKSEQKRLIIADITITNMTTGDIILIERKTYADLAASIIDGRSYEQAARLRETELEYIKKGVNVEVFYLVESSNIGRSRISIEKIIKAMINKQIRDKFKLMRTYNMSDSANYLKSVIESFHKFGIIGSNAKTTKKEKLSKIKGKCKCNNNIPLVVTLYAHKGISYKLAITIGKLFKSVFNLICYFHEKGKHALIGLPIEGSSRKIGKKTSENIYFLLFGGI